MTASGPPLRLLPALSEENRFFWESGRTGVLSFLLCSDCQYLVHPPSPVCPVCLDRRLAPAPVSGRGTVHSFTVNHQAWIPGSEPYILALVSIDEQPDVRLTTNLVDCEPSDVRIGMSVEVLFEQSDDVWLPLFRPTSDDTEALGIRSASGIASPGSAQISEDA